MTPELERVDVVEGQVPLPGMPEKPAPSKPFPPLPAPAQPYLTTSPQSWAAVP